MKFFSKIICCVLIFSLIFNFNSTAKNAENIHNNYSSRLSTAQQIGSEIGSLAALFLVLPLWYKFTIKNNKDLSEMSFTINDNGSWNPSKGRVYFNIIKGVGIPAISLPVALIISIKLGSEIGICCAKVFENTVGYLTGASSKRTPV